MDTAYNVGVSDREVLLKYVIYLDVVWLQNTILDTVLLGVLAKWKKGSIQSLVRIVIAGMTGGIFSTIFYVAPLLQNNRILYELLSSLGMISIALPHNGNFKKRIKDICIESCMLHVMLFVVSGVWHYCMRQGISIRYSLLISLLCMGIIGSVLHIRGKRRNAVQRKKYHVRLFYGGKIIEADALVDTGNSLKEPTTGRPVSIIEKNALTDILTEKIGKTEMCIIPYHSIGRRGILYGIRIPRMEIVKEENISTYENVVVAVYKGTLNISKGCQMILHPDILHEGS